MPPPFESGRDKINHKISQHIEAETKWQCFRNYIGSSAFADVSYLMADVEAKFYI